MENGEWKPVCDGISVGHKRIQKFDAINTEKLRLHILESAQPSIVKDFTAYFIDKK